MFGSSEQAPNKMDTFLEKEFRESITSPWVSVEKLEDAYLHLCKVDESKITDQETLNLYQEMDRLSRSGFPINRFAQIIEERKRIELAEKDPLNVLEKEFREYIASPWVNATDLENAYLHLRNDSKSEAADQRTFTIYSEMDRFVGNGLPLNRIAEIIEERKRLELANKEQLEKIKTLESIDCHVDARAAMILVYLGIKPGAAIDFYSHDENIESIKKKIEEVGLVYEDIELPPFRNPLLVADWAIAQNKAGAERLAKLFQGSSEDREIELGKSLGYPVSATEAYIGKRESLGTLAPFAERRIPSTLRYMLSKDNWQEEIKVAEGWLNTLREVSPNLYTEIVEMKSSEYDGLPFTKT